MLPYEITRIVRAAGFDPLAPPLREGTTYVVRATDFRGILMRVVVDARSGAIRAVNRIVAGPEPYDQLGMLPPPYGAPSAHVPPAYGPPDAALEMAPEDESASLPALPPAPPPPAIRPVFHPLISGPPLPRPRPAELASRRAPDSLRPNVQSGLAPAAIAPRPAPAVPAAAKKPTAVQPMNE